MAEPDNIPISIVEEEEEEAAAMPRPGVANIVDGPGVMIFVSAAAALEEKGVELLKEDGRADNVAAALLFAFVTGGSLDAEDNDEGRPPPEDDDDDDPPKRASRFEDASFL